MVWFCSVIGRTGRTKDETQIPSGRTPQGRTSTRTQAYLPQRRVCRTCRLWHPRRSLGTDQEPNLHPHRRILQKVRRFSWESCVNQPTLFSRPDPTQPETQLRKNPRATEVSGANRGLPASGTHRHIALLYIIDQGDDGATSDEISKHLEAHGKYVPPNQVASRIGELVRDRWVMDSGRTRKTRRGSDATVWIYRPADQ